MSKRHLRRRRTWSLDVFLRLFQPPEGRRENQPRASALGKTRTRNRPEGAADLGLTGNGRIRCYFHLMVSSEWAADAGLAGNTTDTLLFALEAKSGPACRIRTPAGDSSPVPWNLELNLVQHHLIGLAHIRMRTALQQSSTTTSDP
jgi:hypothetical protein